MSTGALTWSEEKPKRRGWWWVELVNTADGERASFIRLVKALRAYGNRFCVLLPVEGWVPVDDFTEGEARWAGPLPEPVEPSDAEPLPNKKLSD